MSHDDYPVTWRLLCLKDGVVLKYRPPGCAEDEFVMTSDEARKLGRSLLGAALHRVKASGTIGAAAEPIQPDRPCEGFRWIGQSFACCDRCGLPFWEHSHDERLRPGASPLDLANALELVPITPEQAVACRAKWGPR